MLGKYENKEFNPTQVYPNQYVTSRVVAYIVYFMVILFEIITIILQKQISWKFSISFLFNLKEIHLRLR